MTTAIKSVIATVSELVDKALATRKGVNVRMEWERDCKTKKTCEDDIRKHTQMVGRIGIDYDNLEAVKAKRESGELPEESQAIWHGKGKWVIFPYLIQHTVTNQLYLRLYKGTSKTATASVVFTKNGEVVTKESLSDVLMATEKQDSSGDCFCVKLEDMLAIGEYVEEREAVEELETA